MMILMKIAPESVVVMISRKHLQEHAQKTLSFQPPRRLGRGGRAPMMEPFFPIIRQNLEYAVGEKGIATNPPSYPKYFTNESLANYLGGVIKIILGLLGMVFLGMILFAGFKWFTAAGDEKKVADAISMINQALFGLAIVIGAYVITKTVVDTFEAARQATFCIF